MFYKKIQPAIQIQPVIQIIILSGNTGCFVYLYNQQQIRLVENTRSAEEP